MTYKELITRFVTEYYTGGGRRTKSGNYEIRDGGLYLFGNRIAFYESDKINIDYQGPYENSSTTRKAMNLLKYRVKHAELNMQQLCAFWTAMTDNLWDFNLLDKDITQERVDAKINKMAAGAQAGDPAAT